MIYRRVCAWCGKDIGEKEFPCSNNMDEIITHAICEDCKAKILTEIKFLKKEDEI